MEVLRLTMNMRARADKYFGDFLLRVGNKEQPTSDDDLIMIPEQMVVKHRDEESCEEELIDAIFPSLKENWSLVEYMTKRAILATTNEYVDELNPKMIQIFPKERKIFASFDEAVDDTNNYYQEEFLNPLLPNGLLPHRLELKVNCPIILLRNLDPSNGLCNGTRMRNLDVNYKSLGEVKQNEEEKGTYAKNIVYKEVSLPQSEPVNE
ncbi:uncharacterized protein LOC131174594 [Hevea brasiliensis]|uniref:uncharacterized protein LOC131174594 n=1 Tax=Hevea brasiliensis TaxID=3981 RepID=UPI0025CD91D1|nr:uncharacterized protein LOC131174594 [Hevea brasiliensis]